MYSMYKSTYSNKNQKNILLNIKKMHGCHYRQETVNSVIKFDQNTSYFLSKTLFLYRDSVLIICAIFSSPCSLCGKSVHLGCDAVLAALSFTLLAVQNVLKNNK